MICVMDISEYPLLNEPNIMLIALKTAAKGAASPDDCLRRLQADLRLIGEAPPEDMSDVRRRIEAALRYLHVAGLVDRQADGRFAITARGRETLHANPRGIDLSVLAEFPDFRAYIRRSREQTIRRDGGMPVIEPTAKYREGYAAYGEGRDLTDNPYDLETAAHLEWENGWSEAREEALMNDRIAG